MIRAVLFDLDGTLLDRTSTVRTFAECQYVRLGNHVSHILEKEYVERFLELDDKGYASKEEVYQTMSMEFQIASISPENLVADFRDHFHIHCSPFPHVHSTLDALKEQGILLGLITNGQGKFQQRKLASLHIESYFDVILISETEGIKKPNPEIFHRALDRLGAPASQSVFVGDHPIADVQGSRGVGMKAIWKRNSDWSPPDSADAIIDDLSEVLMQISLWD